MRAGVGRSVITPPVGIPMEGFAGRPAATQVHDDLTATALVLEAVPGGGKPVGTSPVRLAMVACDLVSISDHHVRRIKTAITKLTGVPDELILLSSSHNHYGPVTDADGGGLTGGEAADPRVTAYVDNLVNLIAGAVKTAASDCRPARLFAGAGSVAVGVNRRERLSDGRIVLGQNPDGPVDPRLAVLRVDTSDGRPLAAVMNYACHAVSLGRSCTSVTADFPGAARRLLEDVTGATCLFLQGAAGDIDPLLMDEQWNHLDRLGLPLGAEAVRVFWEATEIDLEDASISYQREVLRLPPMLPESEEAAVAALEEMKREEEAAAAENDHAEVYWARSRIRRMEHARSALKGDGPPLPSVAAELTSIGIGHQFGVITVPGELFNEIGRRIVAKSPFAHTLFAGYTNGSIDYVPTREAYAEGGYEVTHGCHVAPEAGEMIEEGAVRLLQAVAPTPR